MGAALAHPAQKRLYAQCAHLARHLFGGQCQGIDPVRQAHQVGGSPSSRSRYTRRRVRRVALALFDQEAGLDTPALTGAKIAALVDVVGVQALAG
jgi:hypothetical protein